MSAGLHAFEHLWQRLRGPNDDLRPRVAAWLRQVVPAGTLIRQKRGPAVPIRASVSALTRDDGWRVYLSFHRGPTHEFAIAPTVPVDPTAAEWAVLSLEEPYRHFVPMAWLLELVGEAWVEAGMTARGLPLQIFGSGQYLGPDDRMSWKDLLRAMAYRTTAPLPPGVAARATGQGHLVAPPFPLALPHTPAALAEACRAGEPGAVAAWADALDAAGDERSAELLRWLDAFPAAVAPIVAEWAGRGPFWVFADASTFWWGGGENGTEPGENGLEARRLAALLMGWNVFYPAIEWFLRRSSLMSVVIRASYFVDGVRGRDITVDLGAGDHLSPFDAFVGVTSLRADSLSGSAVDESQDAGEE